MNQWLKNEQTVIDFCTEQLAETNGDNATDLRLKEFYRKAISKRELRNQIVKDAVREFLTEFPASAPGINDNAAFDEKEAQKVRKRLRRSLPVIKRMVA